MRQWINVCVLVFGPGNLHDVPSAGMWNFVVKWNRYTNVQRQVTNKLVLWKKVTKEKQQQQQQLQIVQDCTM
jgi:hypothetical protein